MNASATPRICLSMIVRNEAAIIERCLNSVIPLVDAAVICDTGSTDETPRTAQRVFESHAIPAAVVCHEWRDFGWNRTTAIRAAKDFSQSHGWSLDDTYWLFLDADHELVIEPEFDRHLLAADAISLRQRTNSLEYWNLRLARAHLNWRAVGPTHEHYACDDASQVDRLASLWIRDHNDGGSKADKFTRDIALLSAYLDGHPNDPRTLFYLAQSYAAVGDAIKALLLYRKRVAVGGWGEEIWYSKLAIGRLYASGGDLESAKAVLLDAHASDPARAEPLYELARAFHSHGRFEEAAEFAEQGLHIGLPDRDLFTDVGVYEHGLHAELARSAPGTPLHEKGFASCERLVHSRSASSALVDEARALLPAYASNLRGCRFRELRPELPSEYTPCNPTILRTADGYLVNCRAVNFEQRHLRYRCRDADGIHRTRNVLMDLDAEFRVIAQREMTIAEAPPRATGIRGLEDCRLFAMPDGLYFSCTTTDRHPSGLVHLSICKLADDGRVVRHRPLVGPDDDRPQKNWLPFVGNDGEVYAFHSYDPVRVVRMSPASGQYQWHKQVVQSLNGSHWRGSAGPVSWPSGRDHQLLLVHEGIDQWDRGGYVGRVYLHRFIELDGTFALTRMSRPFVFAHKGVEFSCGMTLDHDSTELVIAFGIEDAAAFLCRIGTDDVDALLQPVVSDQ